MRVSMRMCLWGRAKEGLGFVVVSVVLLLFGRNRNYIKYGSFYKHVF